MSACCRTVLSCSSAPARITYHQPCAAETKRGRSVLVEPCTDVEIDRRAFHIAVEADYSADTGSRGLQQNHSIIAIKAVAHNYLEKLMINAPRSRRQSKIVRIKNSDIVGNQVVPERSRNNGLLLQDSGSIL